MIMIEKIAQAGGLRAMGHGARRKAVEAYFRRTGRKPKRKTLMEILGPLMRKPATS